MAQYQEAASVTVTEALVKEEDEEEEEAMNGRGRNRGKIWSSLRKERRDGCVHIYCMNGKKRELGGS